MKYTFLLPAFKGRYLDEMLRSIKAQTYTDFKVLISDDCSPEDLRSICEPYLSDPRFTYRRNEENMGSKSLVSHWNLLVDMCDTDYLIMASDDDVYEPQFLEEIDALVQKYPDVDLFRGRVKRVDVEYNVTACDGLIDEYETQIDALYSLFCRRCVQCIANYVFKTIQLKKMKGFVDFPLAWGSDVAVIIIMSNNGICNTHSTVFTFRMSGENITGKLSNVKVTEKKINAAKALLKWFDDYKRNIVKDGKVISKRRYEEFVGYIVEGTERYICDMLPFLPYNQMKKSYEFLSDRNFFDGKLSKIHVFYTWLKSGQLRKE